MDIKRENIDDVNVVLKINIKKEDYQEAVDKALKDYKKTASIPGFRPGKAPAGLIKQKIGKAVLVEEVNKVLSNTLTKFIVDEKLPVLGEPLPNEEIQKPIDFDKEENFEFVFDMGLSPEVVVTLDKRSKYDYYIIKVDEEMIDQQVEMFASQFGTNDPVDTVSEKANVRGNFIQLDKDGKELEEGIRPEGVILAINMIKDENIKKEFIGKKQDDSLVFDPVKAFKNKHEVGHMLNIGHEEAENLDSEFKFTIKEITEYNPAEVNEDLVKKVFGEDSDVKTVEDFRNKIKEEIAANLKQSSEYKFALDTRDALVEKNKFDLPEAFLKRWITVKNENLTKEQIDNDFDNFLNDLRWQIISDIIIKDNELKVSDEEAKDYARAVALAQFRQYGMPNVPDEQLDSFAKMMLDKEDERERLYRKLYEDKIMKVVQEKASIKEKEVSNKEFSEMMK
ncbi:MAG: trigger factor [Prolixibacteraceae bacterium]|nr:trigger factor [Prolixibacteraceae bacterium]MBN2773125.1 trigger factor [Prolixibacteraceae bacterium]